MTPASAWIAAARPRTLAAAVVPVAVGLAVAARSGALDPRLALATLAAALLVQIGTNLANDYFDFRSGADGVDRLGPLRVTSAGLVAPETVLAATCATLGAAAVVGIGLVAAGGWPILAVGVVSIACAIGYTGGPFPLAHHGLGDAFVFAFFGVVAVSGTAFLQTGRLEPLALAASLPVGALATAILVVNNVRDRKSDARSGKRTLAVRLGERSARAEYVVLVAFAYLAIAGLALASGTAVLIALLPAPLAIREVRRFLARDGAALNASLGATAGLHLATGLLLAVGLGG